jgi:hypothetical protein
MNKRSFLKSLALAGLGTSLTSQPTKAFSLEALDFSSEDIWDELRKGYRLNPDYINLETAIIAFCQKRL